EVDRQHPVGIAREPEEGGLAETEGPAIAPDDAKAHRHEGPDQEIGGVAHGPGVGEERIERACRYGRDNEEPEDRTTADGLGSFEAREPKGGPPAPRPGCSLDEGDVTVAHAR